MLPGPPLILTCPICGSKKAIDSISSGNTFGGIVWSDSKHYYPMLPSPSPVQRCQFCMQYYFLEDSSPTRKEWPMKKGAAGEQHDNWDDFFSGAQGDEWGHGFGDLSFEETDEAFTALFASADEEKKSVLLFLWLFSYNDRYGGRNGVPVGCPEEIKNRHREVADALCTLYPENTLLVAELLRETGRFRQCIDTAKPLLWSIDPDKVYLGTVAGQIISHAEAGDTSVFELSYDMK